MSFDRTKIAKLRQSCDSFCMQQLQMTTFVCNNCKWHLLYALLQLTTFVCNIVIDNFCLCYCKKQLLSTSSMFVCLLKFSFSVGTIGTGILVMHSCICYFCTMLIKIFNSFCIWQLLYASVMYDCKGCFIYALQQILQAVL